MRFGKSIAFVSGLLSVAFVAIASQHPRSSIAEGDGFIANDSRSRAALGSTQDDTFDFGDRSVSPQDSYKESVVHSAVAKLEQQLGKHGTESNYSASVLEDELQILRQEKEALQTQHLALVGQLRELRGQLASSKQSTALLDNELQNELSFEQQVRKQVEAELSAAHLQIKDQQATIDTLRRETENAQAQIARLKAESEQKEKLLSRLPEVHEKFAALKTELNVAQNTATTCQESLKNAEKVGSTLIEVREELAKNDTALKQCASDIQSKDELLAAIPEMKQELIAAKNELLMKDTELKVLRGAADPKTLAALKRSKRQAISPAVPTPTEVELSPDLLLVEVTGSKVNLRSGPGTEHSPVMQVQRKTRLTVEAREGDWYRVFTPTGSRAYISEKVVRELNATATESTAAQKPALRRSVKRQKTAKKTEIKAKPLDREDLQKAAKDDALVPFGVVNLSAGPSREEESRALNILKNGVGKENTPPRPEKIE